MWNWASFFQTTRSHHGDPCIFCLVLRCGQQGAGSKEKGEFHIFCGIPSVYKTKHSIFILEYCSSLARIPGKQWEDHDHFWKEEIP